MRKFWKQKSILPRPASSPIHHEFEAKCIGGTTSGNGKRSRTGKRSPSHHTMATLNSNVAPWANIAPQQKWKHNDQKLTTRLFCHKSILYMMETGVRTKPSITFSLRGGKGAARGPGRGVRLVCRGRSQWTGTDRSRW
jgi:hypothetical protein